MTHILQKRKLRLRKVRKIYPKGHTKFKHNLTKKSEPLQIFNLKNLQKTLNCPPNTSFHFYVDDAILRLKIEIQNRA